MTHYDILKIGEDKGYVRNTKTGRVFSRSPISLANAERQLRLVDSHKSKEFVGKGLKHNNPDSDVGEDSATDTEMKKDPPKDPKKFIQEVVSSPTFRKGAFTAKAKKHGMKPLEFMKKVLDNPEEYDVRTRRQAQFLQNIQ